MESTVYREKEKKEKKKFFLDRHQNQVHLITNFFFFIFFFQVFGCFDLETSKKVDKNANFGPKTDESSKMKAIGISWCWKFVYHCDLFPSFLPRCLLQPDHCIEEFLSVLQNEVFYIQSLIRRKKCPIEKISQDQKRIIEKSNICGNCDKYMKEEESVLHHCLVKVKIVNETCREAM